MEFTSKELKCIQCGVEFVFTADEQEFFKLKGFQNLPKRCKQCRWPGHAGKPKIETSVKCADCGVETTVPFKPIGKRPVLCRRCYQNKVKDNDSAIRVTTTLLLSALTNLLSI